MFVVAKTDRVFLGAFERARVGGKSNVGVGRVIVAG